MGFPKWETTASPPRLLSERAVPYKSPRAGRRRRVGLAPRRVPASFAATDARSKTEKTAVTEWNQASEDQLENRAPDMSGSSVRPVTGSEKSSATGARRLAGKRQGALAALLLAGPSNPYNRDPDRGRLHRSQARARRNRQEGKATPTPEAPTTLSRRRRPSIGMPSRASSRESRSARPSAGGQHQRPGGTLRNPRTREAAAQVSHQDRRPAGAVSDQGIESAAAHVSRQDRRAAGAVSDPETREAAP